MTGQHHASGGDDGRTQSRANWALLAFLAIAGFFLFTEHRAHLFGVLPFLLLLICPLTHVFMHGKHGSHEGESGQQHDHGDRTKGDVR